MIINDPLVEKAGTFCVAAHSAVGQVRKYTGVPYWTHPFEVVQLLLDVPDLTKEMLAAAYLHDVVEDTQVPLVLIRQEFGAGVSDLVGWLTDESVPTDGNRATRKAIDREHLAQAPPAAQTIKLADIIDNTRSILAYDPNFAEVYLREKRELLAVMNKGNQALMDRAMGMVG